MLLPSISPPLVFRNFNVIHCIEGLEMSGRLFYPPELWLNLCRSCFLFPCLMIYFLYLTHIDPHTYIPTIGTEQYRGDLWGFLRRAACEGSQQAFTQTIYSRRLSVRWIYSKASRRLAWESSVLSSEPQILQRTAGAAAGRTLTWEVSMTTDSPKERLLFGRGGLNATTIENETLKKRRVTLWHNRVLFLVPRPLERWFSHLLSLFDAIFSPPHPTPECAFRCVVRIWLTRRHVLTHALELSRAWSPGSPGRRWPRGVSSSSAVTDWPFSASLLPCSAFRSDSHRPMRVERHRRHNVPIAGERRRSGGSKLGSSRVSERVCGEKVWVVDGGDRQTEATRSSSTIF